MTTADTSTRESRPSPDHYIDLAGTRWPLYKIEALAVGFVLFVVAGAVTQSMQGAVLTAATAAVITWWTRRVHYSRTT
ncbi:hypothetical protein R3Q06_18545 [Rhodococcus erythropolis]|uniref:hypothetical protein n=1 Tax=Rhodococcus erythropolis TaxID=1833 RepID=UPI002948D950|nr:hypothetical protein [Rhodococcus erythropolis]MDV6275499.1 hypothetical protein [Rhodococcus erythropolis]